MEKIQERSREQYNYGCIMVEFEIPGWDEYVQDMIDPTDVYNNKENEFGLEDEPHVTVLYGVHSNVNHEQIKLYLMPSHFIKVEFKDISVFESKDYDVLKFGCESKALDTLNQVIRLHFEYTSDYPEYHPHMTIAYLKKGTGKKYAKELENSFTLVPTSYTYSYADGEKIKFDVDPIEGYTDNAVVK